MCMQKERRSWAFLQKRKYAAKRRLQVHVAPRKTFVDLEENAALRKASKSHKENVAQRTVALRKASVSLQNK